MDPYKHASCDELTDCLSCLHKAIDSGDLPTIRFAWRNLPLTVRAAAGDLAALDQLHGGN